VSQRTRERITPGGTIVRTELTGQNSRQVHDGVAMQTLFIASLFLSVTLTAFMLVVSLTNLASPVLGLTIH
jgi:hypothetical protein